MFDFISAGLLVTATVQAGAALLQYGSAKKTNAIVSERNSWDIGLNARKTELSNLCKHIYMLVGEDFNRIRQSVDQKNIHEHVEDARAFWDNSLLEAHNQRLQDMTTTLPNFEGIEKAYGASYTRLKQQIDASINARATIDYKWECQEFRVRAGG